MAFKMKIFHLYSYVLISMFMWNTCSARTSASVFTTPSAEPKGADASIEGDGRILEDGKEESIPVSGYVVSALDQLQKGDKFGARMDLDRQSVEEEALFPTVLMETTIMRSDPPNFYKFLMEDYLNALVNYMLPST